MTLADPKKRKTFEFADYVRAGILAALLVGIGAQVSTGGTAWNYLAAFVGLWGGFSLTQFFPRVERALLNAGPVLLSLGLGALGVCMWVSDKHWRLHPEAVLGYVFLIGCGTVLTILQLQARLNERSDGARPSRDPEAEEQAKS